MALTTVVLAPTTASSENAVDITVPAGSVATIALYTAAGGALPRIPSVHITHKNPAGTYQITNFVLGNGADPEQTNMPQLTLGVGVWSFIKHESADAFGVMVDL